MTPGEVGELRMVEISELHIPDVRVTSQFDGDLREELMESIARNGLLVPLAVDVVDGVLWVVDGRNRLEAVQALGWTTVPCRITQGTAEGLLVKNLATARQKGKSNPAEEAKVIRHLREVGGLPLERIAELTGLSVAWTRKLNDISFLPHRVLDLVGQGRLGISHAMELLPLKDAEHQAEVAGQAVEWRYTVEQVRARVQVLNNPQLAPEAGGIGFQPTGQPTRIPIPCYVCHTDLTGHVNYIYLCGDCQELINAFLRSYYAQDAPAPDGGAPAVAAAAP